MGQVDVARTLLNKIPSPNTVLYNTLINGYVASGRFEEAKDLLYNNMVVAKGFEPNVITYTILINGFCKQGRLEEVAEIMNSMSAKGPSLTTSGVHLLDPCTLSKDGKIEEALQLFREMSSKGLTYNTLINAFLMRDSVHQAFKLVDEMLFRGCPLDNITYNGLIKVLCKTGAVEKGLGLFEEMLGKGIFPTIITCNILISALCKIEKVNDALKFLGSPLKQDGSFSRSTEQLGGYEFWELAVLLKKKSMKKITEFNI
ncbi:unnamed protein product [Sphenostylis stenocarpa]|uniref:Pentatricopeptide repeat-containing protein n=1 Tax=Sphenostylis stenocarpa TaxID=92480 RepID=A0AA86VYY7_9FABA|nr:unnamed protein product [Sphenostylis stenocarpa]